MATLNLYVCCARNWRITPTWQGWTIIIKPIDRLGLFRVFRSTSLWRANACRRLHRSLSNAWNKSVHSMPNFLPRTKWVSWAEHRSFSSMSSRLDNWRLLIWLKQRTLYPWIVLYAGMQMTWQRSNSSGSSTCAQSKYRKMTWRTHHYNSWAMRKIFLQPSAARLRAQCFGLLLVEKFLTCHKFGL